MSSLMFYHLTRSRLAQTVAELCVKSASQGWRVLIQLGDKGSLARLDADLWRVGGDETFLAHGLADGKADADQPILLSQSAENTNSADVLMLAEGALLDFEMIEPFERVCLFFKDAETSQMDAAREDWKRVKAAGLKAQYWSQADGRWQMKAET